MKETRTLVGACILAVLAVGCVDDEQSLMITNAVMPDPDSECKVNVDMTSSSGSIRLEPEIVEVGSWDFVISRTYWICPEIINLLQPTRDIINLKGEANMVTLDSYEVRYDWGEDLTFDLGPESDPWVKGITDKFKDIISVSIPPGGRYVFCVPLVPAEVGKKVAEAGYWDLPLNTRKQGPSFRTILKFFGTTTSGREVETNEFLFRVRVDQCWLYSRPVNCCDDPLVFPCIPGQDWPSANPYDCRLDKDNFDAKCAVGGTAECCENYPEVCSE